MLWNIISENKLLLFLGVFFAVSLLVIAAIMLDLWDGVHTARVTGERVHSHKLRVTIDKMSEYWRFIIIGFLIDCIGIVFDFYPMPFVVIIFGAGLIVIETKSMFEHARRRESHATELPAMLKAIIECANEKDAHKIIDTLTQVVDDKKSPTDNGASTSTV
jgi:hypothetical protein